MSRFRVLAAAVAAGILLMSTACAGDDEPARTGGDLGAVTPVAGCGAGSYIDPADLSPGRKIARCEPNAPAAQPLKERTTIRMTAASRSSSLAPLFVGMDLGEFDKENLKIEFSVLPFADAMPQLAAGRVDISYGGTEAGLFNAVNQGMDIKWVLGNFVEPKASDLSQPQTGMWARRDIFADPQNPQLKELKGKTLGSTVGAASAIAYPMNKALTPSGIALHDMQIKQLPSADLMTALANKAIDTAWLLDPYWLTAAESPDKYVLVGGQSPGEPLGGFYAGKSMLKERPEVLQAFVRAYIRTVSTHLDGDYTKDEKVLAALVAGTQQPRESLTRTPAITFDWEVRKGTGEEEQKVFIAFKTVRYAEVLPEDRYVDRSFYARAVGHADS
ncbi:ABC transporter substrate-binding protein [Streptosporangium amethystogenes]|uniref:ABC transporter substrate-binding protein n=1 Tax=Streptosporangium amethystogenes TaxID=2002 RepID=UPI0004CB73A6|nr:ABC transporter substrate-binding protein [Streptosporangium amethystogenes]